VTRPALVVLGAINVDLVVRGARLPVAGETVVGGSFSQHHGGKGGNQAVAASRALGGSGRVAMVGAVGRDAFGDTAVELLALEGVETATIVANPTAATGVALIPVDARGENQISVAPGANGRITAELVTSAIESVDAPSVVLASLEVPLAAVTAAAEWCTFHEVPFVLNPAPARPEVHDLLPFVRYLTPNEGELRVLAAGAAEMPRVAARSLVDRYPALQVIVTLGSEGAILLGREADTKVGGTKVKAVDTTGAGDCFNGVFAAGVFEGLALKQAVERACVASALSVTKAGAREGMPTRAEIDAALQH
jgi:ribokinase